ncbi:MAG TPA: DUF2171 domain-containing protein [Candidatus Udaeobacter sp.]|nr:DUF2171 domain-containing protein [Candidatus Udaeobacter sp.]
MIARDASRTPKSGLEVYDIDGQKVGYVDQASDAQGWMQVEALGLGLQTLWIPYRLIESVDGGQVRVTLTKNELRAECTNPPARSTEIVRREGRAIAVTSEAGGRADDRVVAGEVDLEHIRSLLAVEQRVLSADGQEVGRIREFDATMGYAVIENGVLSRKRDVLMPVHLVADVDRGEGVVTLAVRLADLERMRHVEAVNIVVDLPAYLSY